jgi:hypothetical protein
VTETAIDVGQRFRDFAHFHRLLQIRDRRSGVPVPLALNNVQIRMINAFIDAHQAGKPGRFILDKARQMGVSTGIQAFFATDAFTKRHVSALTISKDDESTSEIHSMLERMYEGLPEKIRSKLPLDTSERGRRLFLEHGSKMRALTAGSRDAGRSMALTHIHCSEVAYWPDAAKTLLALRQTVQDVPGTLIVLESTANGRQGAFYEEWKRAVEGDSEYTPLFFGWHEFAAYTIPADQVPSAFEASLTDEEETLRERFNLTLGQLLWRRRRIRNECGGNLDKFHQEYPITWEESFLHSGRPFFQPLLVQRMAAVASKRVPVFRGELGSVGEYPSPGQPAKPYPSTTGRLRILKPPEDGHRYVLALDPAGVITSREFEAFTDKTNARDYCAMLVVDRYTRKAVAYWHSRMDLGLVGYEAAKLGKLYHRAMITVEMTGGYGAAPLDRLREIGYSPLYTRVQLDSLGQKIGEDLGWSTTVNNRSRILEGLRDLLREDPAALAIPELAVEMDAFVEGDSGKAAAAPGEHDDLVMAAAIAFEVCREFPQTILLEEAA